MADLPLELDAALGGRLGRALDVEGKIPAALEALGPVSERDVLLLDGVEGGIRAGQLEALGARVVLSPGEDHGVDVIVSAWTPFRGPDAEAIASVKRLLRPGGRLLVIHDYGRDDVSRARGNLPEYGIWTRRDGPFLTSGFRVRVIHCFWTWDSIEEGQAFLAEAFGEAGRVVGEGMKRPRISYNVAVYHRTF
jgi:hypothetical protein